MAFAGTGAAWLLRNHGHPITLVATLPEPGGAPPQAVAFTSNGGLVTAGLDGYAYVWNLSTRRVTPTVREPSGFQSVALSADGSTLAAIVNSDLSTWSTKTGYVIQTAAGSFGSLSSVAVSSSGVLAFVSTPTSSSTDVWDTSTGSQPVSLDSPDGQDVGPVAISPNGSTVASGDSIGVTYLWSSTEARGQGSGTTHAWTASSNTPVTLAKPDGAAVTLSAFSANGARLITEDTNGSGRIWDVATRQLISTVSDPITGSQVSAVALSPDGKLAATADIDEIYLWNVASGALIGETTDPHSMPVTALSFSPDGTELAAADDDGSTYVYQLSQ